MPNSAARRNPSLDWWVSLLNSVAHRYNPSSDIWYLWYLICRVTECQSKHPIFLNYFFMYFYFSILNAYCDFWFFSGSMRWTPLPSCTRSVMASESFSISTCPKCPWSTSLVSIEWIPNRLECGIEWLIVVPCHSGCWYIKWKLDHIVNMKKEWHIWNMFVCILDIM